MPIQRYRDFEDARRALWVDSSDPTLPDRLRRLWRFTARLIASSAPRGVQRFHTIDEANAERERRIQERVNVLLRNRALEVRYSRRDHDGRRDG